MSRFAVFTVALFALVSIGSQPRHGGSLSESINSLCVCMPTRAALVVKSAVAKTQAGAAELFVSGAAGTE
jgi:hypothetical protein